MDYKLQEIPLYERPRERLIKYGATSLADYELLAILLRTGTKDKSVLEVARDVTLHFRDISALNEATIHELTQIKGIGKTKAIELLAVVEMGRRLAMPTSFHVMLRTPNQTYQFLRKKMQNLTQEILVCIFLNTKSEVITERTLSMGTLDRTVFHPRDILKWALKHSAYAIIIAHNHPSGSPEPSDGDIKMTDLIIEACRTIGLVFIDHIIVGHSCFYSFSQKQILNI